MSILVCSLKVDTPQLIKPGVYTTVRFPFGAAESSDIHRMHQTVQPDGHTVTDWQREGRAGLIWPAADGWGVLTAMVQWEAGAYRELADRFVRDPMDLSTGWDATATDERPPTSGRQRFTKSWGVFVGQGTPLALQVCHDDRVPRKLLLAEFKLAIHQEGEG